MLPLAVTTPPHTPHQPLAPPAGEAPQAAADARTCGPAALRVALQQSRRDTLATFDVLRAARPDLQVPCHAELNAPLWELGHVGWFQDWWISRNPQRALGPAADPFAPRRSEPGDAMYDSSAVPHAARWTLPLPGVAGLLAELGEQQERTLALLDTLDTAAVAAAAGPLRDTALYFHRLALFHEDMHHEAALYMALALDVPLADARWQPQPLPQPPAPLRFDAGRWTLGSGGQPGFAFDNELACAQVEVPAGEIDAQVLRWAEFLPFADDGGYDDARWWTPEGWAWRQTHGVTAPRYLRREAHGRWLARRGGDWQPLVPEQPAVHLSAHEARAWCRWAGRRLPTEAEWERAAVRGGDAFRWGDVWEWTASEHAPYPGFVPHPYRDYAAPFFDGRPVLRGGSFLTQPRMKHPRYRNYFQSARRDIAAGLRSCAL
jgi:ergothioneine biosynthesis protein EgtB